MIHSPIVLVYVMSHHSNIHTMDVNMHILYYRKGMFILCVEGDVILCYMLMTQHSWYL